MTPIEAAFQAHRRDLFFPFMEALQLHALNGVVIATPQTFLLARPIDLRGTPEQFDDPRIAFPDPDCWHVWLAAGDLSRLHRFIPYPLTWVSWVRKNRLRVYPWALSEKGFSTLFDHGRTIQRTKRSESGRSGEHEAASTGQPASATNRGSDCGS